MGKKSRPERRHQRERARQKAIKLVRSYSWNNDKDPAENKRRVGIHIHTRRLCSCWLCQSPRKIYGNSEQGRTFSERRKLDSMRDDLDDL